MVRSIAIGIGLGATAFLAACTPTQPSGASQQAGALGFDVESGVLVAAEMDNGRAVFVDVKTHEPLGWVETGNRPERVIVRGDDVFVSNRGSRTVTHLKASTREVVRQIATGAEPMGLRLSPDGSTLVVANAMSRSVQAFAVADGSLKWETEVGEEVRAVAVLPDGRIYAPGFKTGGLRVLDLRTGALQKTVPMAQPTDLREGVDFDRTPVATQDVVVAPDGRVYVPHQQVTNIPLPPVTTGYYAIGPQPAIVPGVTTIETTGDDVLVEEQPDVFSRNDPADYPFPPPAMRVAGPMSGPTVAVVDSRGEWLYVVNQFSRNLSIVSTTRRATNDGFSARAGEGMQGIRQVIDGLGHGANGLVLDEQAQRLYVYNSFDHTIDVIASNHGLISVTKTIRLDEAAPQTLTARQQIGRKLFHDATDGRLTDTRQGGVSCASCHPGGREDGHTWSFVEGVRNTPSLVGTHVAKTLPLHWDGQFSTVTELQHVVTNRMGGNGLPSADFALMMEWLAAEPLPDNPHRSVDGRLNPQQALGREIFENKAGCIDCHTGETFTDNGFHDVGTGLTMIPAELDRPGMSMGPDLRRPWDPNTPSLIAVFASEPYLHHGRARTLKERVLDNPGDQHGVTSTLNDAEVDALVAYLQTL